MQFPLISLLSIGGYHIRLRLLLTLRWQTRQIYRCKLIDMHGSFDWSLQGSITNLNGISTNQKFCNVSDIGYQKHGGHQFQNMCKRFILYALKPFQGETLTQLLKGGESYLSEKEAVEKVFAIKFSSRCGRYHSNAITDWFRGCYRL